MKFLKYLGISIAAIIVLFLISFVITLASSESTEETIELERITITEPTKSFMEVELKSPGKDPYIVGKCNFPDSTKLSLTIFKDGYAIIGGADWTDCGRFVFSFKKNVINADSIEISCIKIEKFHNPDVFKQLQLVDSGVFTIEYKYNMLDLYRISYQNLLEYEAPKELDLSTVTFEDWTKEYTYPTRGVWKRSNFIIKPIRRYSKKETINQMKHLIIEELAKDPTIEAVRVEYDCDSTYSKAIFAPNGDWLQEEFESYSDYKLVIKDVY